MSCKSKICSPPIGTSGDTTGVSQEIIDGCQELNMTNDQLKQYMEALLDSINKGLGKDTNGAATMKCFPTYVQDIPDGTESGKFLALDLGGSNFRVLYIELGKEEAMKFKLFQVPQSLMVGEGAKLFDFLAECLSSYAGELGVADQELPLGFTFSFPLIQVGLEVGIIERWTKGFDCADIVNQDVVQLLKEAIERRGDVHINVVAVLNDTTGTLISAAYNHPDTKIGLILGTGTNACYVESQANAELFDAEDKGSGKVLINTEWGAFGDDGVLDFIRTEYDRVVDEGSINAGRQLHEKMISGMYLGELARLAMVKFANEGLMFGGEVSDAFNTREKFKTKFVSDIEWEVQGEFTKVKKICDSMGMSSATEQDYINMKYICSCMSRRAGHLVAAGLATLINKIGDKQLSIGIDGTLYRLHPHIRLLIANKIRELIDPSIKYNLVLASDGSGRGAALVAAVSAKSK